MFLLFWWSHQHNASFFDKYSPIFQLSFKNFSSLTQIMKKYAIVEISTKKKIICDTESINTWIWADEAYRFTDFLNITSSWRHNDFILDIWVQIWDQSIKFSTYAEFQLIMLSIGWDIAMWLKTTSNFSTICLNKSGNKKRINKSFSILFSVMGSLEIAL